MTALQTRPEQRTGLEQEAWDALGVVMDPELDEAITSLGFVRSLEEDDDEGGHSLRVHLRLPTSFCSPNFAYLMCSDAKDVLEAVVRRHGAGRVLVELDDHHDSDLINRGLAADAGYKGTFGHEAESDLDELRLTFRRKAHTAAAERALTALLRARPDLGEHDVHAVRVADLLPGEATEALLRRRSALGLSTAGDAPVAVDDHGTPVPPSVVGMWLRKARSTRISIDGNAHFCRGLLATRYPGAELDQAPRDEGTAPVPVQLLTRRPA
ncbi:iron-sulfur cluster assembly protein [Streptomyces sp. NP160]|uniref:iron-sulfur cluster assembly protein n=1 Tax=Streptomyces sp. NP160 TaxID=2586637 RepID=UPI00214CAC78|nr:iron-sulfur cluster assembly protein [Streptomyces sp. NP160]